MTREDRLSMAARNSPSASIIARLMCSSSLIPAVPATVVSSPG